MRVALTFDDGPAQWTAPILDLLAEHDAHATFFVCGWAIPGREDLLARMMEAGHAVGNHTFTHPQQFGDASDMVIESELWETSQRIRDATGEHPRYWRAPHFATSDRANLIARNMGMEHVACDIDPGDWGEKDSARIASRVIERLTEGAIVDLHDGLPPDGGSGTSSRQPTVDAIRVILVADAEFVAL